MKGFTAVTLEGGGMSEVGKPVAVLLAFSAGFVLVAAVRFRTEDAKVGWA